jgi:hypothetical protein
MLVPRPMGGDFALQDLCINPSLIRHDSAEGKDEQEHPDILQHTPPR